MCCPLWKTLLLWELALPLALATRLAPLRICKSDNFPMNFLLKGIRMWCTMEKSSVTWEFALGPRHQLATPKVLHNPSTLQYYTYNCNYKCITLQLQLQHYKSPAWHSWGFAQPVNITSTLYYLNTSHHINNPQKCKHSSTTTYFLFML